MVKALQAVVKVMAIPTVGVRPSADVAAVEDVVVDLFAAVGLYVH